MWFQFSCEDIALRVADICQPRARPHGSQRRGGLPLCFTAASATGSAAACRRLHRLKAGTGAAGGRDAVDFRPHWAATSAAASSWRPGRSWHTGTALLHGRRLGCAVPHPP